MKLIEYEPCEGMAVNNPFATSIHNRYCLATKLQTQYVITLGERLKNKTWFVNGNHAEFCFKKIAQAGRIIEHYLNANIYKARAEQIGVLNRDFGYIGFEPIMKGTPVYELDNERCYFNMTFLADNSIHKQVFKKETLKPSIT